MKRAQPFALAGVAILALLGAGCDRFAPPSRASASASGSAAAEAFLPKAGVRPPNILLVTVDTLRADHLSAWGYGRATSPNLDRLASQGLRFDHAKSKFPKTRT